MKSNAINSIDVIEAIGQYLIGNGIEVEVYLFRCVFTMPSNGTQYNIIIYGEHVNLTPCRGPYEPAVVLWSQDLKDPEALPNLLNLLRTAYV